MMHPDTRVLTCGAPRGAHAVVADLLCPAFRLKAGVRQRPIPHGWADRAALARRFVRFLLKRVFDNAPQHVESPRQTGGYAPPLGFSKLDTYGQAPSVNLGPKPCGPGESRLVIVCHRRCSFLPLSGVGLGA
jgi:hypothetical protein